MQSGIEVSQETLNGQQPLTPNRTYKSTIFIMIFEDRKNLAKKLGEEAGTKMMIPMFIMLAVVFIIVIVPAFFSIQI